MTTKEKILYILKKDGEISMKELVTHFTISDIAVRKHVQSLVWDGFIKKRRKRQAVGRPYHLYSLTKKGHHTFPNQYEELPVQLLQGLEKLEGKETVDRLLQLRSNEEEKEIEQHLSTEHFDERIREVIKMQEEKGYMIDFHKNDRGDYEMRIFNCPIYNLASHYGQVCVNEEAKYQNLFPNCKVKLKSRLTKGAQYCSWIISQEEQYREKTGS